MKRITSKFSTRTAFQAFLNELRVTPSGFRAALCRGLEYEQTRKRQRKAPYPLARLKRLGSVEVRQNRPVW